MPSPGDGTEEDVLARLPSGLSRVCVLGSTELRNPTVTRPLLRSIATSLQPFEGKIVVLTGGMAGVQREFADSLGSSVDVINLVPLGTDSGYKVGQDVACGKDLDERIEIYGRIGDVYLSFEGGPGVAKEANAAFRRGAPVLALRSTGGASAGKMGFPEKAFERPEWATEADWGVLSGTEADPSIVATGVSRLIASRLQLNSDDSVSVDNACSRVCCDPLFDLVRWFTGDRTGSAPARQVESR